MKCTSVNEEIPLHLCTDTEQERDQSWQYYRIPRAWYLSTDPTLPLVLPSSLTGDSAKLVENSKQSQPTNVEGEESANDAPGHQSYYPDLMMIVMIGTPAISHNKENMTDYQRLQLRNVLHDTLSRIGLCTFTFLIVFSLASTLDYSRENLMRHYLPIIGSYTILTIWALSWATDLFGQSKILNLRWFVLVNWLIRALLDGQMSTVLVFPVLYADYFCCKRLTRLTEMDFNVCFLQNEQQ